MAAVAGLAGRVAAALAGLRGELFAFVPVGLGIGIGFWFQASAEPDGMSYGLALVGLVPVLLACRLWDALQPFAIFAGCILCGFLVCGLRVQVVAAPVLAEDYYGPLTGRIVEVDRSQAGALRITLDQVWLAETPPDATPARVRLSLQGDQRWLDPIPGTVVMATAFLSAPQGPVEPGAFDFRLMAFFDGLGAVGYTRHPVLPWAEPAPGEARIGRLRTYLSAGIRAHIPGDPGAFAAGVLTGDRSGLSRDAVEALRDSSLAHLLAISGMNMAFLIAFVFALLRYGLALIPRLSLRMDSKKLAAVVSLGVAGFYLLLSGSNVATERAFIMVAVMLGAVLLDRRAITLRSVALAGTILLVWQPEALLSPGFQMSFAATVALIAGFAAMSRHMQPGAWPRWVQMTLSLLLSSLLGGIATAPFAAAHFNRFTDFGLLANLLTGPVMGLVVMPAGAVAALAAPFGLAALPLWVMELGCRWILYVAHSVAALDGSVTAIPAPPAVVLPVLTLGLCWLVFWPGPLRLAGLGAVIASLGLWHQAERPTVLIGAGGLVGVMGQEGRAISTKRGGGFVVQNWLENDGDLAERATAAARPGFVEGDGGRVFTLGDRTGLVMAVDGPVPDGACMRHAVIILRKGAPGDGPCLLLTDEVLSRTGTVAIYADRGRMLLRLTHDGSRAWSGADAPASLILPGNVDQ